MELPNGEKGSVLIHNNHLEMWGIDEKTLKEVDLIMWLVEPE